MRVFLEEEYGYRYWWWYPPASWSWIHLVSFWVSIRSMSCCDDLPSVLPGTLVQISDEDDSWVGWASWRAHYHEDRDSFLCAPWFAGIEPTCFYHSGHREEDDPTYHPPILGHFIIEPEDPLVIGDPFPRIKGFVPATEEPHIVLP